MPENEKKKQAGGQEAHFVKTIDKTTYSVVCHFSEASKETVQDKLRRVILWDMRNKDS